MINKEVSILKRAIIGLITINLIFIALLSGCTKEEGLVGAWELELPDDEEYDYSFTYTFYENNSLKVSYYMELIGEEPYSEWGSYTVDGNQLCIVETEGDSTCATFQLLDNDNQLKLIDPDNPNEDPVIFNRVS